jgi:hypothetical protein
MGIPKQHKYYGLVSLIKTRHDNDSDCCELRKIVRRLLPDFEDCEADFNMVGNCRVSASFFKKKSEFHNKFLNLITCTEYNSLIYFEVICLLKPLVASTTTYLRDIVYLKNVGLLANSWYDSLEYHFGRDFINSLSILPKHLQLDIRMELKKTYREREVFRQSFKHIRNAVLAHRCVTISEYLNKDGQLLDQKYIDGIISFLNRILHIKALLFTICLACTEMISEEMTSG